MECKSCYTKLDKTQKFCHECGTKINLICTDCNNEILVGDKFCRECGAPTINGDRGNKIDKIESPKRNYTKFNVGDYIKFGRFHGRDLVWVVINHDEDNNPMLFSEKVICNSRFGKNSVWKTSDLRHWLNNKTIATELNPIFLPKGENKYDDNIEYRYYMESKGKGYNLESLKLLIDSVKDTINNNYEEHKEDIYEYIEKKGCTEEELREVFQCEYIFEEEDQGFLNHNNFTDYEYSLIKLTNYKVALTEWEARDIKEKKGGETAEDIIKKNDLIKYTNNIENKLSKLKKSNLSFENAISEVLKDRVFLLSFDDILNLYDGELSKIIKSKYLMKYKYQYHYWLRNPLPGHMSCVLAAGYDDSIDYQDCIQTHEGVRPALYLDINKITNITGDGSKDNPFVLI